jgi:hypothetical protein
LVAAKPTVNGAFPDVVDSAIRILGGAVATEMETVPVLDPPGPVVVNLAVYEPVFE